MGILAVVSAVGLAAVGPALAQAAGVRLEEIVVTAQKREERLLDVPLPITSLDAETLRTNRISRPEDLASYVSGVDVKDNVPGAMAIVTIRGVGLNASSSTNNPAVGFYVDDVFLASFAETDFDRYDTERIEVLKGPQGTLYGRNSTAGAINIISAAPSLAGSSGQIALTAANFDRYEAEGFANLAVNDQLALRFSAKTVSQGEGYWFSRVLNTDLGEQNIRSGRFQLLWRPSPATSVKLKLEGERNNSSIGVGKFFGTVPTTPGVSCPDFSQPALCVNTHGYTDTTSNPFQGDWNHPAPYRVRQWNATLHVDQDLGFAQLTSVTGYIQFKRSFYFDADAAPTTDAEFDQNDKVHQFSQELRLAGGKPDRLTWVAGAYYSWDQVKTLTPGDQIGVFNTTWLVDSDQNTTTRAVFGQAEWTVLPRLRLIGGLRYTDEDRAYVGGTTDLNPFGFSRLCVATHACTLGAPGPHVLSFEDADIHDSSWSWRGGVDYKPSADSLIYAFVARATKSGGFFNGFTTSSFALAPYRPEQLTDYEAGFKTLVFDRRLQLDASAFWYNYDDLQTQVFTSVGAVELIKLGNVGSSRVKGLDGQATWRPARGLSLGAGLTLLDAKLGSFETTGPAGPVTVPKGNKLPNAPDVSFNGQARYEWPVAGGWTASVQGDAHYSSKVFEEALNKPYLSADSYWLLNARAAIASHHGLEIALWCKNLTDERYVSQAIDVNLGMGYRIFNAPRTYGVTVTKQFD